MTNQRFHSLDALRAFALLLGICFHAAMPYVLPPGFWAVGTTEPASLAGLFIYYLHSFRMEVFFLLAGFFARLVIEKRGVGSFLKSRAVRIGLVFVVALYPMKLMLAALWMIGGKYTGWLQLPPEVASLTWWQLALGSLTNETFPDINLAHLWFLYYLLSISALFLIARWVIGKVIKPENTVAHYAQATFRHITSSWLAPIALAMLTIPLLKSMTGFDVDTPDKSLRWHWPVLALYGLFFTLGWVLHRHADLLATFGKRWVVFLPLSLIVGLVAATCVGISMSGDKWAIEHAAALRWATTIGTALTMGLAVFGWLGLFVRLFDRPLSWVRYLADSSYWVYLVHLPLVVALQIAFANWAAPWWIKWPLINAIAFPVLILSYHWCVRYTWIGKWLNGHIQKSPPVS